MIVSNSPTLSRNLRNARPLAPRLNMFWAVLLLQHSLAPGQARNARPLPYCFATLSSWWRPQRAVKGRVAHAYGSTETHSLIHRASRGFSGGVYNACICCLRLVSPSSNGLAESAACSEKFFSDYLWRSI